MIQSRELHALLSINNPFVLCAGLALQTRDVGEDLFHNFILPFCPKSLHTVIEEFPPHQDTKRWKSKYLPQLQEIVRQLFTGLEAIHAANWIHRDLNGRNILVTETMGRKKFDFEIPTKLTMLIPLDIKIADLGCACLNDGEKHVVMVGSPAYRSPELFFGADKYGFEVDIWSMGCTIAEFGRGGKALFPSTENSVILDVISRIGAPLPATFRKIASNFSQRKVGNRFRKIQGLEPRNPVKFDFSHEFEQLVKTMLQWDPQMRPSAKVLRNHRFLQ